jgi:hypothetical protein
MKVFLKSIYEWIAGQDQFLSAIASAFAISSVVVAAIVWLMHKRKVALIIKIKTRLGKAAASMRIRFLSVRARIALRFAKPQTLIRIATEVLDLPPKDERDKRDEREGRFYLARTLAYFGDERAVRLDKIGAAYGMFLRGDTQKAIDLLVTDKATSSAALIHWENLTEIEESCKNSVDYDACLADLRSNVIRNTIATIVEMINSSTGREEWPSPLTDITAYLKQELKPLNSWVAIRDVSQIDGITPERLRALCRLSASVTKLDALAVILPCIAMLSAEAAAAPIPGANPEREVTGKVTAGAAEASDGSITPN